MHAGHPLSYKSFPPWVCALRRRACLLVSFSVFFRFFAFQNFCSIFDSKKSWKKCENHWFWPPKPLPKGTQNASKIEVQKFWLFLTIFLKFSINFKNADPWFCRHGQCFVSFLANTLERCPRNFNTKKPPKNHFKKHAQTMKKSMQKTMQFLTSLFFDFFSILDGFGAPKWPPNSLKIMKFTRLIPPQELHIVYGFDLRSLKCRI